MSLHLIFVMWKFRLFEKYMLAILALVLLMKSIILSCFVGGNCHFSFFCSSRIAFILDMRWTKLSFPLALFAKLPLSLIVMQGFPWFDNIYWRKLWILLFCLWKFPFLFCYWNGHPLVLDWRKLSLFILGNCDFSCFLYETCLYLKRICL